MVTRVLVDRGLGSARDHQPDVHAVRHGVGVERPLQGRDDFDPAHADVEFDGPGALEQPVQVRLQEQQPAPMQPQAFPDPIAQGEAGVEHRHHRLAAGDKRAIDVDEHVLVARVGCVVLAAGHGA